MVSTYIECLSCQEMWREDAILDAVAGNEDIATECIDREMCPDCLAANEMAWQEAAKIKLESLRRDAHRRELIRKRAGIQSQRKSPGEH